MRSRGPLATSTVTAPYCGSSEHCRPEAGQQWHSQPRTSRSSVETDRPVASRGGATAETLRLSSALPNVVRAASRRDPSSDQNEPSVAPHRAARPVFDAALAYSTCYRLRADESRLIGAGKSTALRAQVAAREDGRGHSPDASAILCKQTVESQVEEVPLPRRFGSAVLFPIARQSHNRGSTADRKPVSSGTALRA
jgi:hypothetical protein